MKYTDFDIEDFLTDEFFIQWVKNPSEETNHFWMKWISNHQEKKHTIQKARELILMIDYKKRFELSDQAYMDLFENIVDKSFQKRRYGKQFLWSGWHKTAAILFLVFSTMYGIKIIKDKNNAEEQVQEVNSWLSFDNPAGQKYKFKLPDGTTVHMNAESSIEYPEKFEENQRMIKMKGEAYFDVVSDSSRPFIIQVKLDQVKVLGTSFNLKNTDKFELALVEGKVEVQDTNGEVITLLPNEMLTKDESGNVSKTAFDPMEIFGWKDQYLIFKDDSYPEVIQKMEAWFGVKIKSSLKVEKGWSYSGSYHNKPLNQVLDGISISSEFDYKIEDKTVIISNP